MDSRVNRFIVVFGCASDHGTRDIIVRGVTRYVPVAPFAHRRCREADIPDFADLAKVPLLKAA